MFQHLRPSARNILIETYRLASVCLPVAKDALYGQARNWKENSETMVDINKASVSTLNVILSAVCHGNKFYMNQLIADVAYTHHTVHCTSLQQLPLTHAHTQQNSCVSPWIGWFGVNRIDHNELEKENFVHQPLNWHKAEQETSRLT